MGALIRFLSWLLRKLTFGVVLVAAGVVGFGLWLYLRDHVDFDQRQQEVVRALTGQRSQLKTALSDVEARTASLRADIAGQEQRAAQAARVAAELADLNSGFNRLGTSAEQLRLNEERLVRMREMEAEARARAAELQQTLMRGQWEKDGLEIALGRLEVQIRAAEEQRSRVIDFVRESWTRYGLYVVTAALVWLIGPPLARLLIYFVIAPFISHRRPVRLGAVSAQQPEVLTSRASVDVALEPGDVLWVKEQYLQASDEGLLRSTCWLLDWRMPFTCLAAGLKELIEVRNPAPEVSMQVTLSSQQNAHVEMAVITVPAGASVVLRPSFLAGMIGPVGRRSAAIRRHWRMFTLQSWATGQFRYFEFVGPCRLLLAGSRGVRAEVLGAAPNQPGARRTNQDATIGFTPGLAYRPVRAETFWAYFRGQNPLFDDLFEGHGVFLCQQTSAVGEAAAQRRLLAGFRDGLLRIFGL